MRSTRLRVTTSSRATRRVLTSETDSRHERTIVGAWDYSTAMLDRLLTSVAGSIALITGLGAAATPPMDPVLVAKWKHASVCDLKCLSLEGKDANLAQYAGKVLLIVNVASQCGLTKQYAGLQKLYETYKDKGLVVLGVPSGDFGGQEFEKAEEIRAFCNTRYQVSFPLLAKCGVKVGAQQAELFECLSAKTGELPTWNFGKYLVARDGSTAVYFACAVTPEDPTVIAAIEEALARSAPTTAPATTVSPTSKPVVTDPNLSHPAPTNE